MAKPTVEIKLERVAVVSEQIERSLDNLNRKKPSLEAAAVWERWLWVDRLFRHNPYAKDKRATCQLVGSYHAHSVFGRLEEFRDGLEHWERKFIDEYEAALGESDAERMGRKMAERFAEHLDGQLLIDLLVPPTPQPFRAMPPIPWPPNHEN